MSDDGADEKNSSRTCPSAPATQGSVLFGVIAKSGQVAYLSPNIPVSATLLRSLEDNAIAAENRLRFAGPCLKHQCVQWRGDSQSGRCGLIDHGIRALNVTSGPDVLPHCGLRSSCRWFSQHGKSACAVCPEIVRRSENDCTRVDQSLDSPAGAVVTLAE